MLLLFKGGQVQATQYGAPGNIRAVLNQMNADGDYPEVVWEYADAIAGDGTIMGGKRLTVEESYKDALGCRATIPSHK